MLFLSLKIGNDLRKVLWREIAKKEESFCTIFSGKIHLKFYDWNLCKCGGKKFIRNYYFLRKMDFGLGIEKTMRKLKSIKLRLWFYYRQSNFWNIWEVLGWLLEYERNEVYCSYVPCWFFSIELRESLSLNRSVSVSTVFKVDSKMKIFYLHPIHES